MSRPFRIAVLPGDGIGKEVMPEGLRVLRPRPRRGGEAPGWLSSSLSDQIRLLTGVTKRVGGVALFDT